MLVCSREVSVAVNRIIRQIYSLRGLKQELVCRTLLPDTWTFGLHQIGLLHGLGCIAGMGSTLAYIVGCKECRGMAWCEAKSGQGTAIYT